ncbi:MAG: hypothetical protein ACE5HW_06100 [Candidatus Methanofastidiosia archaeon]
MIAQMIIAISVLLVSLTAIYVLIKLAGLIDEISEFVRKKK